MQAVNLLLATDQANLFFILGLDREMVAAGLAAKNEAILPYLAAGRREIIKDGNENLDKYKVGIEYGYAYLEKFIQVPFRVPQPDDSRISSWVSALAGTEQELIANGRYYKSPPAISQPTISEFNLTSGKDPEGFENVVRKMAEVFDFNPRRVKQFINVFRLRVAIAITTRVLAPDEGVATHSTTSGGISLEQLGLFTAILLRWPQMISDLVVDPSLISRLSSVDKSASGNDAASDAESHWGTESKLMHALNLQVILFSLGVDVRPLLMVLPNAYFGDMELGDSALRVSRLVPSLSDATKRGVEGVSARGEVGSFRGSSANVTSTAVSSGTISGNTRGPTGPAAPVA